MGTADHPWQHREKSAMHLPRSSLKEATGPARLSSGDVRAEHGSVTALSALIIHSLESQFWPAKSSWLRGAGKKNPNHHRFIFNDPSPPLLRNAHCFCMSQSLAAKMELHPHKQFSCHGLCSLLVECWVLSKSFPSIQWFWPLIDTHAEHHLLSIPLFSLHSSPQGNFQSMQNSWALCATLRALATQGLCEILNVIKASLAKNSVGFVWGFFNFF